MRKFKLRLGKTSWGHLRLGSWVGVVAVLVGCAVNMLGKWIGTPDALWVDLVGWIAISVFASDIFYSLCKLTPRKRWEAVMMLGLAIGGGLLVATLLIWLKGGYQPILTQFLVVGGFILLVMGGGGWWLWRRARQRLNGELLDRKMKKKRRGYE